MVANSKIEWCGPSWNPFQGCVKKTTEIRGKAVLREECRHCYMHRDKKRYGQKPEIVIRSKPPTFKKPLKIQKEVEQGKRPNFQDRLVFACSWTDFFNPEADKWRPDAWDIIRQTPDLIYQILTKLPDRIGDHLPSFWDEIKHRIWLGYTCGMPGAEVLIPELFGFGNPVNFLSCEPLSGYIDLIPFLGDDKINWVIAGGESGPKARPMHSNWLKYILDNCKEAEIPFFFKQWGEWIPATENILYESFNGREMAMNGQGACFDIWNKEIVLESLDCGFCEFQRVGTKKAGATIEGTEYKEFPSNYRILK